MKTFILNHRFIVKFVQIHDQITNTFIKTGQEKGDFWSAIGGKESYANSKRLTVPENSVPARLFHCSNATGTFKGKYT